MNLTESWIFSGTTASENLLCEPDL